MKKIIVEIEYQEGAARDITPEDVRRALTRFVPHRIASAKERTAPAPGTVKNKVHEWVVKMWDERKLSALFSDKDEQGLVRLIEQVVAHEDGAAERSLA